ncbi:MAG: hypothetical protein GF401_03935 [Chitinivibrionales bacterium]|nr:hypothetical protein [Chitinivibrionales bacterium]
MNTHHQKAWYFNVSFDLFLAGYDLSKLQPIFNESTIYFACVGMRRDRILLDIEPDPSFFRYLDEHEIDYPLPLSREDNTADLSGSPWGWDSNACSRFESLNIHTDHPSLDTVKKVNSRTYSFGIGEEFGYGVPGARLFCNSSELFAFLERKATYPSVIKPFHGNAGIGFMHMKAPGMSPAVKKRIENLCAPHNYGVIYEPWLQRAADISTRLTINRNGTCIDISHHQTLNNSGGVFYGIVLAPNNKTLTPWRDQLDTMAHRIGAYLFDEGYWGPVGIDSIVYEKNGALSIALCVEINARRAMSIMAYSLREKLAPDSCCLFEFAQLKNYRDINSYTRLSSLAFNRKTKKGVFLFTPLSLHADGRKTPPQKIGFFITAPSMPEMWEIDTKLRSTFKKKPGSHQ